MSDPIAVVSTSKDDSATREVDDIAVDNDNRESSPLPVLMETENGDGPPSPPNSDEDNLQPSSPTPNITRDRRSRRGAPALPTTTMATSSESAEARDDEENEDEEEAMDEDREEYYDEAISDRFNSMVTENVDEMNGENEEKPASDLEENDENGEDEEEEEDETETEEEAEQHSNVNTSFNAPLSNKDHFIHVGAEYQATIRPISENLEHKSEEKDRDLQIWDCDAANVDAEDLDDYILHATGKWTVPIDRALYILTKCDYDCVKAERECAQRRQLRETWTTAEKNLFQQAIHMFPKKFKSIQSAMPHRSLGSIVQFYYETKHQMDYKRYFADDDGTPDPYDEVMDEIRKREEKAETGICENCAQPADALIHNRTLQRNECKPCIMFFHIMHRPRPVELSRQEELRKNMAICPEYMRMYVKNAYELQAPADGKAHERLGFGPEFAPKEEVDDDIEILDPTSTEFPSGPYKPTSLQPDEAVDENTCRMTRTFYEQNQSLRNLREKFRISVPLVWRVKETKCMEEIRFINDQARILIGAACSTWDRINKGHVNLMKAQVAEIRKKRGENFFDPTEDVPESTGAASRSGKIRCDSNWTPREKKDCVRCFHWYLTDFKTCSEILGTKTAEQVEEFYMKHKELIEQSIEAYQKEVRAKNGVE